MLSGDMSQVLVTQAHTLRQDNINYQQLFVIMMITMMMMMAIPRLSHLVYFSQLQSLARSLHLCLLFGYFPLQVFLNNQTSLGLSYSPYWIEPLFAFPPQTSSAVIRVFFLRVLFHSSSTP